MSRPDAAAGAGFRPPLRHDASGFVLRPWQEGDGASVAVAIRASYEHLSPWMEWATPDASAQDCEELCLRLRRAYLDASDFVIGVVSADGSRVLGGTGFHLREGPIEDAAAEIGMWIHGEESGRGLGTRVLVEMLRWGFGEWPWLRLSWRCDTRNVASVRVAEKAGMVREGTLRSHRSAPDGTRGDTACFAALRGEWSPPILSA